MHLITLKILLISNINQSNTNIFNFTMGYIVSLFQGSRVTLNDSICGFVEESENGGPMTEKHLNKPP